MLAPWKYKTKLLTELASDEGLHLCLKDRSLLLRPPIAGGAPGAPHSSKGMLSEEPPKGPTLYAVSLTLSSIL